MDGRVEDIIAENDKLAVRWPFTGTYNGERNSGPGKPGRHPSEREHVRFVAEAIVPEGLEAEIDIKANIKLRVRRFD